MTDSNNGTAVSFTSQVPDDQKYYIILYQKFLIKIQSVSQHHTTKRRRCTFSRSDDHVDKVLTPIFRNVLTRYCCTISNKKTFSSCQRIVSQLLTVPCVPHIKSTKLVTAMPMPLLCFEDIFGFFATHYWPSAITS